MLCDETLREHLGVRKDDLDDPVVKEANDGVGDRHPDWVKRADRLASALRSWHALLGEEKKVLRQMRVTRKLEAVKHERQHG
jgi:hypothetical protein